MESVCNNGRVNAVWREEAKHVTLLPVEKVFETLAKGCGAILDIGVCVRTVCVTINDQN
jgi:hypothetical protein